MFCNKCGQQSEDNVTFCSKCGNSISGNITTNTKTESTITITAKKSRWYELIFIPKLWVTIDGVQHKIKFKKSITLNVVPGQHLVDMYYKQRILFIPFKCGKKQLSIGVRDNENWKVDYKYPFFNFQQGNAIATK